MSESENVKKQNLKKMNNIIFRFNLANETEDILLNIAYNNNGFKSFCNKYSKLHGKTKQVKKEFLLMMAYSLADRYVVSDSTNFTEQKNDTYNSILF